VGGPIEVLGLGVQLFWTRGGLRASPTVYVNSTFG